MGAGQSDTTTPTPRRGAPFSKSTGATRRRRRSTRFKIAFAGTTRRTPTLGTVTAEEADVSPGHGQKLLRGRRPRTDGRRALGPFTEKLARAFRRAALEAVSDIETARRELVRRAVDAEKASAAEPKQGGVEVVPFGPPPRPADESAAESPRERARRGPSTRRSGSSPRPVVIDGR